MPEEHTGQLGFEFAWKELLMRSRQSGMCFWVCMLSWINITLFLRRTYDLQLFRF
jgi:golgi-specific brefeldin A-resistance guanine nucleotide exchange factor 1